MRVVSVSDLKAHLSRYLKEVRRGGEIQIVSRGMPVARLIGGAEPNAEEPDARRRRLVRAGIVKRGKGDASSVLRAPPIQVESDLGGALDEEREDRV